jgi:hypothetical protein
LGASLCAAKDPADKIPKEVRQAEQSLSRWLDSFDGMTPEQVRKSLGAPAKESSWLYEDKKVPLWKYQVGETTTLSLYFGTRGRVVKVSLFFLP